MDTVADVVRRLWGLCNALRDDGISYHEYLDELSTLLFLKLAEEMSSDARLGKELSWSRFAQQPDSELIRHYHQLLDIAKGSSDARLSHIFAATSTKIQSNHALRRLIDGVSEISWYRDGANVVGNIYEGLIEKNATESRYGAGQYFTPRALVEAMVAVTHPTPNDLVYDPAAGTAGFLIAAAVASKSGRRGAQIEGQELVPSVHRMALMNTLLHGLDGHIGLGDTLSLDPKRLQATLCLSNPPFGVRGGLAPNQQRLLRFPTANKQLAFLQHVYASLVEGGRAAVVLPDNVLFETGIAGLIRTHLLDNFNVHTVLRLPPGIFYATGVRTSVLFFANTHPTERIWTYDLRSGGTSFTKKRQIGTHDLSGFVTAYGASPLGESVRTATSLFHSVSREDIRTLGDTLDIPSPKSKGNVAELTPEAMVELLVDELESALAMARDIAKLVSNERHRDVS
ncbi:N-6 DNA methylase [Micromonospora sp. NPDC047187]|uniref:class I SAM-dependent DNA methyltransferase n=1 Tax=Micromonospora sp. NPDC047187 TaxID=3155262 RepID=UPI0033C14B92